MSVYIHTGRALAQRSTSGLPTSIFINFQYFQKDTEYFTNKKIFKSVLPDGMACPQI